MPLTNNITFCYKITLCSFVFCLATSSMAQVGINTTSPKTTLEIRATDPSNATTADGLLVPKINLSYLSAKSNKTIAPLYTKDQTGALLFVNGISGSGTKTTAAVQLVGFHYFDGTIWRPLVNQSNNPWFKYTLPVRNSLPSLVNTDTIFTLGRVAIGKVDPTPVQTTSTRYARLSVATSLMVDSLYIGSGDTSESGTNIKIGIGVDTDAQKSYNIIMGYRAGKDLTSSGNSNTLIGPYAGAGMTTGRFNVILGSNTGATSPITTGQYNIGIGNALNFQNPTGNSQLNIGNLIYGTGISSSQTAINSNSKLAIDKMVDATTDATLDVAGIT